jgi:hypothetical protein
MRNIILGERLSRNCNVGARGAGRAYWALSLRYLKQQWDGYACGNFSQEHITMPRRGVKKDPRSFSDEDLGRVIAAARERYATKRLLVRMNRDTLYSFGVFDLAQPVTIVKPDTGKKFQLRQKRSGFLGRAPAAVPKIPLRSSRLWCLAW